MMTDAELSEHEEKFTNLGGVPIVELADRGMVCVEEIKRLNKLLYAPESVQQPLLKEEM